MAMKPLTLLSTKVKLKEFSLAPPWPIFYFSLMTNRKVPIVWSDRRNTCFVLHIAKKAKKHIHVAKNFVGPHNHSPRTVLAVQQQNKVIEKYAQSLHL